MTSHTLISNNMTSHTLISNNMTSHTLISNNMTSHTLISKPMTSHTPISDNNYDFTNTFLSVIIGLHILNMHSVWKILQMTQISFDFLT